MPTETPDLLTWNPFHVSHWGRTVFDFADYGGGDHVSIALDPGRRTEAERKKALKEWCANLPRLDGLRWLSLWMHTTPPLFDAACRVAPLECLQVKWSSIRLLDPIHQLQQLKYLSIGSSTKIEALEPLASLPTLRLLEVENFKLITDFSPLLALTQLESLSVTGSMWTRQRVGSLEPFAQMTWLRALAVDTAHVKSIRPLANLTQLERLGLGGRLPMEEYAWLSAKLPNTECQWFRPYLDVKGSGFLPCATCHEDAKVMPTGKGAGLLCRNCDADALQRHIDRFESARARARAD